MNKFSKIKFGDGLTVTDEGEGVIRVDGSGGGSGGGDGGPAWTQVTKAADESVTNNNTPQDDNELFFTAANGAIYEFEAAIIYLASSAAPHIAYSFSEDTTARGAYEALSISVGDTAAGSYVLTASTAFAGGGALTTPRLLSVWGWHVGAGGTFRFRWAQNYATSGQSTTVKAGSLLRYRRIL